MDAEWKPGNGCLPTDRWYGPCFPYSVLYRSSRLSFGFLKEVLTIIIFFFYYSEDLDKKERIMANHFILFQIEVGLRQDFFFFQILCNSSVNQPGAMLYFVVALNFT